MLASTMPTERRSSASSKQFVAAGVQNEAVAAHGAVGAAQEFGGGLAPGEEAAKRVW